MKTPGQLGSGDPPKKTPPPPRRRRGGGGGGGGARGAARGGRGGRGGRPRACPAELARRHLAACRAAVAALAHLDALCALAALAASPGYCRPRFAEEGEAPRLVVVRGRHPTLDLALQGGAVPNDVHLSWDGRRGAIVTGGARGGGL